jgi:hypothetical protein
MVRDLAKSPLPTTPTVTFFASLTPFMPFGKKVSLRLLGLPIIEIDSMIQTLLGSLGMSS